MLPDAGNRDKGFASTSPFFVAPGIIAAVEIIVAIAQLAGLHDKEMEVHHRRHAQETDQRRRMQELNLEREAIKQGA